MAAGERSRAETGQSGDGLRAGRQRRRLRKAAFAAAAVLLGLSPFVALELALRALGVGSPAEEWNPFIGFSRSYKLFERVDSAGLYRTSQARLYFFAEQQFPIEKGSDTFRAFCLGGSTVLGHPYLSETSFVGWLQVLLGASDASRNFEFIDCGGMSYASYRLLPILKEVLGYEPNLIIVASGHNEFLEDRTYGRYKRRGGVAGWLADRLGGLHTVVLARRLGAKLRGAANLPREVDAKLDHASGYASYHRDPEWRRAVVQEFRRNLHAMAAMCRRARVPLLLVNLGSNLRDCPPFKSEHRSGLSAAELARWQQYYEAGLAAEARSPQQALQQFRQAEQIDDQYAELLYHIGRCLDRLGRYEAAYRAYVQAKEFDVCPLRILAEMNAAVLEVARKERVPVVDADRLIRQLSRHGIPGYDWYVDHVHPTIRGHQKLAEAIAGRLLSLGLVSGELPGRDRIRQLYARRLDQLGELYLARGRTRLEWLENWARRDRLRRVPAPLGVRGLVDRAATHFCFAEVEEAKADCLVALTMAPQDAVARLLHLALRLYQTGLIRYSDTLLQLLGPHLSAGPSGAATGSRPLSGPKAAELSRRWLLARAALHLELGRKNEAEAALRQLLSDRAAIDSVRSDPWLAESVPLRQLLAQLMKQSGRG